MALYSVSPPPNPHPRRPPNQSNLPTQCPKHPHRPHNPTNNNNNTQQMNKSPRLPPPAAPPIADAALAAEVAFAKEYDAMEGEQVLICVFVSVYRYPTQPNKSGCLYVYLPKHNRPKPALRLSVSHPHATTLTPTPSTTSLSHPHATTPTPHTQPPLFTRPHTQPPKLPLYRWPAPWPSTTS